MPDIQRILSSTTGHYSRLYQDAIDDMVVFRVIGNERAYEDAVRRLQIMMRDTMGVAEVLGVQRALQAAAKALSEDRSIMSREQSGLIYFAETQTVVPNVTFDEALKSLVDRVPTTLHKAAERTAENIARLYGVDSGGVPRIAFVRSAETAVTQKAQRIISEAVRSGIPEREVMQTLSRSIERVRKLSSAWSEAYSQTVFRTNLATAASAGEFRQAMDPDIRAVLPAFQFLPVMDSNTRPNHAAGNRLIFQSTNRIWQTHSSPMGYACRCTQRLVSKPELRRMNRINKDGTVREDRAPSTWFPDPGFRHGGRPDLFTAAAVG